MGRLVVKLTVISIIAFLHAAPWATNANALDKGALREAACAKEPTATQRDICLDIDLTRRDAYLNEVYAELKRKLSKADFKVVRADQRAWIEERNTCGANSKCTAEKYQDRTAQIEQMLENIAHPNKSHVEIGCDGPDQTYKNGICLTKPGSAAAHTADMVWQTSAFNDPSNKGRYTARLWYGVPETDDVAFESICSPGGGRAFAATTMGYNTGNLREGASVTVDIKAGDKTRSFAGEIYGTQIEEGVSGILFRPEVTDTLWDELMSGTTFTYAVRSRKTVKLSLKNAFEPIQKFNEACKAIAFAGADTEAQAPSPKTTDTEVTEVDRTCSFFGFVKSTESKIPVTVTFINKTEGSRSVMWINFDGTPVSYAELNPGQSYTTKTFESHPWMFTDGPGNCIEMFMTTAGTRRYEITAKSPAFGPGND